MNILACLIGMKHYVVEGYTILNYLNLKPIRRISYNTMPVFSSFTASDLIYKMNMTYPITHNNDDSSTYLLISTDGRYMSFAYPYAFLYLCALCSSPWGRRLVYRMASTLCTKCLKEFKCFKIAKSLRLIGIGIGLLI